MTLRLITGPTEEPITLGETKEHLRIDLEDDDMLVSAYIKAARELCETVTRTALVTQTWELVLDAFPASDRIEIPLPPLVSVTSIKYTSSADVETTVTSTDYRVVTTPWPGYIVLKTGYSWPSTTLKEAEGVVIRFVAGYGTAISVPQSIKEGMLLYAGHLYENREGSLVGAGVAAQVLPMGVEALWWPKRWITF